MIRLCPILMIVLALTLPAKGADDRSEPLVYVVPVNKMIEPALLYVVRRGIDEATRNEADAIVLQMDTTGGRVDAAVSIVEALGRSEIPIYTLVEKEAISAGAMIALSTKDIYMRPGSVIGDITPISMGMTGGVQDLPEAEKEKMTSYVAAHVRSAAEQGGHDPELAEAMVRREIEYKMGDIVISKSGTVLTLTDSEAARRDADDRPLLSQGTVKDLDELLERIELADAQTIVLEVTPLERIARAIAAVAPLLMMIGLGGLWLEFKTPGFGLFGLAGLTCLLLFFFGHHIAGLAGMEDLILFILGVGLLVVELFITPGFGILGAGGILLILISFISAMSEHMPGSWRPIEFSFETFAPSLIRVLIGFTGAAVLVSVLGRYMPNTALFRTLTLNDVIEEPAEDESMLGWTGLAHSDLRPGGTAYFDQQKLDVITRGDFIPSQTQIRIVEVHGSRIVVERVEPA